MTKTPIVDDYIPIAQRLAQIEQDKLAASFSLPEGVVILSSKEITASTRAPASCYLCLVTHEALARLTVMTVNDRHMTAVHDFVKYLTRCYPSTRGVSRSNSSEIQMAREDFDKLIARMRWLR